MLLTNAPVTAMIPSTDIKRSKEFYSEKLGLKESQMRSPEDAALYDCGAGTSLYVYVRPEASKAQHTLATFTVENIEEIVKELSNKGVVFEHYALPGMEVDEKGIATMGGARTAWIKDPDENILGILQVG